jgi:hypothetical protein
MICTAKAYINGLMEEHTRVGTSKIKKKVMASTPTLMEEATRVIGKMAFNMVKEYAYIQTEKKLKVHGTKAKD